MWKSVCKKLRDIYSDSYEFWRLEMGTAIQNIYLNIRVIKNLRNQPLAEKSMSYKFIRRSLFDLQGIKILNDEANRKTQRSNWLKPIKVRTMTT